MKRIYDDETIRLIKIFGMNVKKIRLGKNISIKELSEKTGIREKYLKKIEKGEAVGITITQMWQISEMLNSKIIDLIKK